MLRILGICCLCLMMSVPTMVNAESKLPSSVEQAATAPLKQVGTGRYKKLGFSVYQASLWAAEDKYDPSKPFALQLDYKRDLSKETVVDALVSDLEAQNIAGEATMSEWKEKLNDSISGVSKGDSIVALSVPGKPTTLFLNGKQTGEIADERLSKGFFNIWLGDVANADLRAKLLASAK